MDKDSAKQRKLDLDNLSGLLNSQENKNRGGWWQGVLHTNGSMQIVAAATSGEFAYRVITQDYGRDIQGGASVSVARLGASGNLEVYALRGELISKN